MCYFKLTILIVFKCLIYIEIINYSPKSNDEIFFLENLTNLYTL